MQNPHFCIRMTFCLMKATGSTPIFWKKIGITVPDREETTMASTIAAPRLPETAKAMRWGMHSSNDDRA